jgi:hypothetical protein
MSQNFQVGSPEIFKIGIFGTFEGHNFLCRPLIELSNDMWHITYMQMFQGDSQLLVVGSQIGILTPDLFFGHKLCFKYSNGSCEAILDIYVSRTFQWFKQLFNPMSFDPWNTYLKIQYSIGIPTPKVRIHLGVFEFIPSHFQECKCDS